MTSKSSSVMFDKSTLRSSAPKSTSESSDRSNGVTVIALGEEMVISVCLDSDLDVKKQFF